VARVFLRPRKGQISVNGRAFEHYFVTEAGRTVVRQPLLATEMAERFDVLDPDQRRVSSSSWSGASGHRPRLGRV